MSQILFLHTYANLSGIASNTNLNQSYLVLFCDLLPKTSHLFHLHIITYKLKDSSVSPQRPRKQNYTLIFQVHFLLTGL